MSYQFDMSAGVHRIKNSFIEMRYVVGPGITTLDSINITKEFRGLGYGTAIVGEFIKQSPYPVEVTVLYHRPLPFYLSLGFKITEAFSVDDEGRISEAVLTYDKNLDEIKIGGY